MTEITQIARKGIFRATAPAIAAMIGERGDGSSLADTAKPVSVHLPFTQINYVRRATDVERLPG
ncbi:hypothetical protein ACFYXH_16585 [Streptomyces sp. NPDC002730]|uniref:hypothetical protein n=1 Tax=Streptomyces sp. NPDC002730 TaxID=3364662 RepID=UPI003678CBD4